MEMVFQSTRPHGARLHWQYCVMWMCVSIHAPARGATQRTGHWMQRNCFNPRARTGRDRRKKRNWHVNTFQSTRPHGARLGEKDNGDLVLVSIHAPARGAT